MSQLSNTEVLEKAAILRPRIMKRVASVTFGGQIVPGKEQLTFCSVIQLIIYLDMEYSDVLEMELMTYPFQHVKVILEWLILVLLELFTEFPQY